MLEQKEYMGLIRNWCINNYLLDATVLNFSCSPLCFNDGLRLSTRMLACCTALSTAVFMTDCCALDTMAAQQFNKQHCVIPVFTKSA